MSKWREDARPEAEWPEPASPTGEVRGLPGRGRGRAGETQAFPETASTSAVQDDDRDPETRAIALRDPWAEPEESGRAGGAAGRQAETSPEISGAPTHDPHEVTVQLDAVGLHLGQLVPGQPGPARPGGAQDASDGPVFVDESGRRSRTFRRIGMAVGLACAIYAVVMVVTLLSGSSNAPWLPVPDQNGKPAGKVDSPPLPAQSAQPTATGVETPGSTPTAGPDTTPVPGDADATAPGTATTPDASGTSADPTPTATRTAPDPGTSDPAPPVPSSPVTNSPAPSPTGGTSADPSPSAGGDSGGTSAGTGTVADGPPQPVPAAQDQAAAALTTPSL
ncbi:hypothetical protein ACFV7R_32315 [Streptomyces sp. NPDC059866]|uniref:hypothetical protein n=1 Tax=Streptomyces sp. NPDC059866 TaxID=3346978 RepID=UPI0036593F54